MKLRSPFQGVLGVALGVAAAACGSATTRTSAVAGSPSSSPTEAVDAGADELFGTWLLRARKSDGETHPVGRCLIDANGHAPSELRPALQPVPLPPKDLDAQLASDELLLLSPWGTLGTKKAPRVTVLATVTFAPPVDASEAVVVAFTDRGVHVRGLGAPSTPVALDDQSARMRLESGWKSPQLVITAEAAVPWSRIRSFLASVPESLRTDATLAVALPEGTRINDGVDSARNATPRCDNWQELDDNGSIDVANTQRILGELFTEAQSRCGLELVRGGLSTLRVEVTARVNGAGEVIAVCDASPPSNPSTGANECLVDEVKRVVLPRNGDTRPVDLRIPVTLNANAPPKTPAVCETSEPE
ncbi:MAG: hypothetical protein R3A78_11465 [Polyangiales bacterium]